MIGFWLPHFIRLEIHEGKEQTQTIPEAIVNQGPFLQFLWLPFLGRKKETTKSHKEHTRDASLPRTTPVADEPIEQVTPKPTKAVKVFFTFASLLRDKSPISISPIP